LDHASETASFQCRRADRSKQHVRQCKESCHLRGHSAWTLLQTTSVY